MSATSPQGSSVPIWWGSPSASAGRPVRGRCWRRSCSRRARSGIPQKGALLLAVYSLGIGIPFILAALFVGPFLSFMKRFRRHLGVVETVMGILLIATGVLFMTGQITEIGIFLDSFWPEIG